MKWAIYLVCLYKDEYVFNVYILFDQVTIIFMGKSHVNQKIQRKSGTEIKISEY